MATDFSQTEVWIDRNGNAHRIDDMDLSYKRNVVRFVDQRAPRMVAKALADRLIDRLSKGRNIAPCVLGEVNGKAIECNATHRWEHGVDHAIVDYDKYPEFVEPLSIPKVTPEEARDIVRRTALMQRLLADIAAAGEH